jgi:hypothetical protein
MAQTDNAERDGFQVTNKVFTHPSNAVDQVTKRQITICNLFANHELSIPDIVRVLDETHAHVVSILIEQGYIQERRRHPGSQSKLGGVGLCAKSFAELSHAKTQSCRTDA